MTRAFSAYGTVFVKIRRDSRTLVPYAFCQFHGELHPPLSWLISR